MALLQEERDNFINDINLQQILYSPHVGPSSNIILPSLSWVYVCLIFYPFPYSHHLLQGLIQPVPIG